MKPDLSVKIGNIEMKNPVTTASGTFGQGDVFEGFYDINILGALTTKSVSLNPKQGNPPPRIAETRSGYLNSIGLQNPGISVFLKKYNSFFDSLSIPVILSIAGNTIHEYGELAKIISEKMNVQGLEINISCPNVREGGLQFACQALTASKVVREVRSKTHLTLITKLSPNTENNVEIAKACVDEGTDAISVINTVKGMAIDLRSRKPLLANITGGLSGPAIKPVALRWVYELSQNISVPLIGMGGIETFEDALEFIVCGASAVSIGTANFYNPYVIPEIIHGMEQWMKENKVSMLSELRNTLVV